MIATGLGSPRSRTPAGSATRGLIALPAVALLLALASLIASPAPDAPAADELGTVGFSYRSRGAAVPDGQYAATSSLWFHDGAWWGVLFRPARDAHAVNRYDADAGTWVDTATVIDDRNASRADVLWTGSHLYAVSGGPDPGTDDAAILARLSYDTMSGQFAMDRGFPIRVTPGGARSFTLDQDDTGRLWVTWTYGGRVWVRHSVADDRTWSALTALPLAQAEGLSTDDVSSVVAYDGHIGIMWSDRAAGAIYWASLPAGRAADDDWTVTAALRGTALADSRIDLLGLRADPVGQVVAAVKTARDAVPDPRSEDPQVLVLVLGHDGAWTRYVHSTVGDDQGSPVLALDADHRTLHVLTSGPCCEGGTIYHKASPIDAIDFEPGVGTPFIRRAGDSTLDGPTTTKQPLTRESGLLVVASDARAGEYMQGFLPLAGPPVPRPPAPTSGPGASPGTGADAPWLEDGFESGTLDAWPNVETGSRSSAAADPGQARTDAYGAHLVAGPAEDAFAYARFPLPEPQEQLGVALDFRVLDEGEARANVPLVRLLGPDGRRIVSVYRQNGGQGGIWIATPDQRTATLVGIELDAWSRLEVELSVEPRGAVLDVRLDGQFVGRSSVDLGEGVAFVQIGNEARGQLLDIAIDNVVIAP